MKKSMMMIMMMISFALLPFGHIAHAATATVGGYTYTYYVVGGGASISNGTACAVTPLPTGALTIPSFLGGYPVTTIGNYAFTGCSALTGVTIPSSVTSLGNYAFRNCTYLTTVNIAAANLTSAQSTSFSGCTRLANAVFLDGARTIPGNLFYNCTSLRSVTIPSSVTSIGNGAFYGCSGLTGVTIGAGVTSIGTSAFYNCTGLTNVNIAATNLTSAGSSAFPVFSGCTNLSSAVLLNGVKVIPSDLFYNRTSLKSVAIPPSVTSIGDNAFYGCVGLTGVTIPSKVTSIGAYAFYYCTGLVRVKIPQGVTSIGNYAFSDCSSLGEVFIGGNAPSVGTSIYMGTPLNLMTYISEGSTGWDGTPGSATLPSTWCGRNISYSPVTTTGVPYLWLETFFPDGGAYETIANRPGANGIPVWQSYVAGLDPTDALSKFLITNFVVNAESRVTALDWTPRRGDRVYTVYGKTNLLDTTPWFTPTNSGTRFFKVEVKL